MGGTIDRVELAGGSLTGSEGKPPTSGTNQRSGNRRRENGTGATMAPGVGRGCHGDVRSNVASRSTSRWRRGHAGVRLPTFTHAYTAPVAS